MPKQPSRNTAEKWTWEEIACPDAFMCGNGRYVSAETVARQVGYGVPVILTIAAWKEFVAWTQDTSDDHKRNCESTRLPRRAKTCERHRPRLFSI
jgi:hypothetical protein